MKTLMILLSLFFSCVTLADTYPLTYNRIHLAATASLEVENDLKVAELFAKHQDASSVKVSDKVNRDIKWAVAIAKEQGVEVRTLGYNTNPLYERTQKSYNQNKIIGWTATQAIQIKSKNSELLGDVIGMLQQKLKMRSLSYQVSKQRQNETKESLMDKAIANFVKRAQKAAQGFGLNSYRLVNINVNTNSNYPRPQVYGNRAMKSVAMAESASIESGTSEINVSVNGEIELIEPLSN